MAEGAGAARPSVRIRRAAPADRRALTEMLARCSDETRRRRFHSTAGDFPERYLAEALDGPAEHYAILAELLGRHRSVAGMASCRALTDGVGELALLVEDAYQRRGVGKMLLEQLLAHADRAGLRTLTATVLAEQDWVSEALRVYGSCASRLIDGVFQVTLLRDPECLRPALVGGPVALPTSVAAGVRESFARDGLMHLLGAQMRELRAGWCVISLPYRPQISQQHGYFHGAAIGAVADVAGGYAAASMAAVDRDVLTVELKLSLYKPATGARLEAVGTVLRPGSLTTCLIDVYAVRSDGSRQRCATALQTVKRIPRSDLATGPGQP